MAGLGRKVFAAGDVLSAADVDGYLMDQTVMTFAGTAAAGSAIGTAVSEGMVRYLKATDSVDTANQIQFYNGSAWESVRDIEAAGRNKIINGGFDIWQRGTSTAVSTSAATYLADRFLSYRAGFAAGATVSRQSSGLTGIQYAYRVSRDSGNTSTAEINTIHNIETANSIGFAGQVVTLSFYARKGANYSTASSFLYPRLISGTGTDQSIFTGYTGQADVINTAVVLTTSWQRFTFTGTVSLAATELGLFLSCIPVGTAGAADYYEITGIQLEAGSVATPFSRAGGTIQGELAACQRYYFRETSAGSYWQFGMGNSENTAQAKIVVNLPVPLRVTPSAVESTTVSNYTCVNAAFTTATSITIDANYTTNRQMVLTVGGSFTAGLPQRFVANNNSTAYIGISAEL